MVVISYTADWHTLYLLKNPHVVFLEITVAALLEPLDISEIDFGLDLNPHLQKFSASFSSNELKLIKKYSDEWEIDDSFYNINQHEMRGGFPPDEAELARLFERAKKLGLQNLIDKWGKVYPNKLT